MAKSVLDDVYRQLNPTGVLKFFTSAEPDWVDYLQRDQFTQKAFDEFQTKERKILNGLITIEAFIGTTY